MPHTFGQTTAGRLTAIVDIGSNTVRLVVFHGPARVPMPIFNEKVQCRLGAHLDDTGLLNPEGVDLAYESLKRFMKLVEVMQVDHVSLLATAAVREARNGPHFVKRVEQDFGAKVTVLSGEEEAKLAAYGVLSGLPHADGLLGDMGGSSFDLVSLNKGQFHTHDTTPLGHLRILSKDRNSNSEMRKFIRPHLKAIPWLNTMVGRPFYAVGGALRAVARLIMDYSDYPLHIIDNYTLSGQDAAKILKSLAQLDMNVLYDLPDVSKKRIETLPAAIVLLQEITELLQPKEIIFSGYSMREGQFFQSLPDNLRQQDPLISACLALAEREGRFGQQGEEVYDWMAPLFPNETENQQTLRHAACLLNDITWAEHPDYRADHALLRVLRLPVAGLSHHDRALLAACIYSRYKGDFKRRIAKPLQTLLATEDAQWTKAVGAALRLAHTLSSGAPHLLEQTHLECRDDTLILNLPTQGDIFTGDAVARRVQTVAKQFGLKSAIEHF